MILHVAIPDHPLRRLFDYLPATGDDDNAYQPGQRVRASFGKRSLCGIVVSISTHSDLPRERLKPVDARLDDQALLPADLLKLARWAADYYHAPVGDVLMAALPVALRQGQPLPEAGEPALSLSEEGRETDPATLKRKPRQAALLSRLQASSSAITRQQLRTDGFSLAIIRSLVHSGLAVEQMQQTDAQPARPDPCSRPELNPAQQAAVDAVNNAEAYVCFLLDGVTGSGKTEIYLHAAEHRLKKGKQALLLAPEIGLTPQLLQRFQQRFGEHAVAVYHSGLSENERCRAWQAAANGQARILIGTRSAIFVPMPELGLIVIDEEHDSAFKQQDGVRYSGRDVAIKRAYDADIPIVLGSATPSAESFLRARSGRYQHLRLPQRAGHGRLPDWQLIDLRQQAAEDGLSPALIQAMTNTLKKQQQVLLFLNRRGFSPSLICQDCGWRADCLHCSAAMTLHHHPRQLRCHHCDHRQLIPRQCPQCQGIHLMPAGQGTQRSEQTLRQLFPQLPVLRIDRDQRPDMAALAQQLHRPEPAILIGTQMLAKGHDFPHVTLVGVLDADSSLLAADFRGPERLGQLLTQVAGRAGRSQHPGRMLVQTHRPEHPWLNLLMQNDYHAFLDALLPERKLSQFPPYGHLALLRSEDEQADRAEHLLQRLHQSVIPASDAELIGPLPCPLERRAGRFRFQLLVRAASRAGLHATMQALHQQLHILKPARSTRWHIDIDPLDAF